MNGLLAGTRNALWQLGFFDCYHMSSVIDNLETDPDLWVKVLEAKYAGKGTLQKSDFDKLLGKSQACVDVPAAFFGAELAEMYPDAKVIILNRDPEKWYDSVLNSIHKLMTNGGLTRMLGLGFCFVFNPNMRKWARFGDTMDKLALPFDHGKEKDKAIAWFNNQYKEFRDRIPAERRMEFRVQDGWGPLCEYLEVPVPMIKDEETGKMVEAPFPHVNDREAFEVRAGLIKKQHMATAKQNMFAMLGRMAVTGAMGYAGYLMWKTRLGGRL